MNILVVEDEVRLADTLAHMLKTQKFNCDVVYDGADGLAYGETGIYDCILLDIMLPKMDGFEVVRHLREKKIATPVILLTARDKIGDKVRGLDSGADDYLTKPFSSEELMARLRAVTRRKGEVVMNELTFSDLTLGLSSYQLSCGEKSVRLGFKEFSIMKILMSNVGALVSKEELITKVWGYLSDAEDNNVEVYVSFLRKKLTFLGSKVAIESVRKLGYHLEERSDKEAKA
ncbi:MAG: response regulator transcription factor [Ruminococcus sp.]|jgi:two component transcriptional regulator, winged helix family|nr:response regulator transcription factor [Ruminococcus sp.]MDD7669676.1 response regulator transcription factor [Ruminococcus sp.]CDD02122.1 response regulator receiver domain protein [Ruminococcus sp. CAG:382]